MPIKDLQGTQINGVLAFPGQCLDSQGTGRGCRFCLSGRGAQAADVDSSSVLQPSPPDLPASLSDPHPCWSHKCKGLELCFFQKEAEEGLRGARGGELQSCEQLLVMTAHVRLWELGQGSLPFPNVVPFLAPTFSRWAGHLGLPASHPSRGESKRWYLGASSVSPILSFISGQTGIVDGPGKAGSKKAQRTESDDAS